MAFNAPNLSDKESIVDIPRDELDKLFMKILFIEETFLQGKSRVVSVLIFCSYKDLIRSYVFKRKKLHQ